MDEPVGTSSVQGGVTGGYVDEHRAASGGSGAGENGGFCVLMATRIAERGVLDKQRHLSIKIEAASPYRYGEVLTHLPYELKLRMPPADRGKRYPNSYTKNLKG